MINPASYIDHTLLKATATADEIRSLCEEAVEWGFASVCIPPIHVKLAAELLYGSDVAVGTVVGFPLGYVPTELKAQEAAYAVSKGASEIDMVIPICAALDGDFDTVEEDIRQVAAQSSDAKVKVILECCYLDDTVKKALTQRVVAAGAAYVKTSTGFGSGGATVSDVAILASEAGGRIGVKAAGGIRDLKAFTAMLEAGATRIGTSSGVSIMEEWKRQEGL